MSGRWVREHGQLMWLAAKSRLLNTILPTRVFRHRAACAWVARTAHFAGPVVDFDDVVDEYHREVLANGAGSSDWQNGSIGPLRMRVDLRSDLHRISCPTLFIQGDRDRAVAPRHTREAAQRVPGARLEVLDGTGHWPNRQSPDRVNALIRDFLTDA